MADGGEAGGDSQASSLSNFSFDLSQDTLNQVMSAVGMQGLSGAEGDRFIRYFHTEQEGEEEESGGGAGSSISISRAILHASNLQPWSQQAQLTSSQTNYCTSVHSQSTFSANTDLQATPTRHNHHSMPILLSPFTDNGSAPSTPVQLTTSPPHHLHTPQAQHLLTSVSPSAVTVTGSHTSLPASQPPHPSFPTAQSPHATTQLAHPSLPASQPLPHPASQPPHASFPASQPPCTTFLASQPPHAFMPVQHPVLKSNIPANQPYPGQYGFGLVFSEEKKRLASKTANFTYSTQVQRLYIKQGAVIPFNFTFSSPPPFSTYIRTMAIHKQAEMIAESLTCCPKHVDDQRKKGLLFPLHFVRSQAKDSHYCEESGSRRLSVLVQTSTLQRKPPTLYTGLFVFPCFTSDLQRPGQLVQLIFTLEGPIPAGGLAVLGRCTVDIRVCASPGRDRAAEERKTSTGGAEDSVTTRRPRKRTRSSNSCETVGKDVIQCTVPPKEMCSDFSGRKVTCSVEIHEELVPYLKLCAQMLEQVYSIKVDVAVSDTHTTGATAGNVEEEAELFSDLDSWLEHLDLSRYRTVLSNHGVNSLFQVMGVTDEELRVWGMTNPSHRRKFLEGKSRVMKQEEPTTEEVDGPQSQDAFNRSGSPPFFSLSQSPSAAPRPAPSRQLSSQTLSQLSNFSSASVSSTQPFGKMYEVLQIQVTKPVVSRSGSR